MREDKKNKHRLNKTIAAATLLVLASALGCSSWGGKMRNTEGIGYYSRGDYDQALDSFQTAARLNPDDSEIYYNIASTYQQQATHYQQPALLTQAENYYRQCLEKNPSSETTICCYRGLATVLNQKNANEEALTVLRDWETRNPTSLDPKLEIAYLLEAQGKYQEAGEAFEKIVAYAPNDYRAYYKLGMIHQRLGQDDKALTELRNAARLNPSDTQLAQQIATLEAKGTANGTNGQAFAAASTVSPSTTPLQSPATAAAGGSGNWENRGAVANTAPRLTGSPGSSAGNSTAPPLESPQTAAAPIPSTPSNDGWELPNASVSKTQATSDVSPFLDSPTPAPIPSAPAATIPGSPTPTEGLTAPTSPTSDSLTRNEPSVAAPAPLALSSSTTVPDGTGANPFNIASSAGQTAAPIQTASLAPATTIPAAHQTTAAATAPPLSADSTTTPTRKTRVGEMKNDPPQTNVGAPF